MLAAGEEEEELVGAAEAPEEGEVDFPQESFDRDPDFLLFFLFLPFFPFLFFPAVFFFFLTLLEDVAGAALTSGVPTAIIKNKAKICFMVDWFPFFPLFLKLVN